MCGLVTIIVGKPYGRVSVWAALHVLCVWLITPPTTHCFGGNSLNYSSALIGSLNGAVLGFFPLLQ